MWRADPGWSQPDCTAGPALGHLLSVTALLSSGSGDVSTTWDQLPHTQTAGKSLKHRHRARQGEVTIPEPWGPCRKVPCRQGDAHSHRRCQSPPHHAGKSSTVLLGLGQQPAGSKGHFLALSSCLFIPFGLPSLLFQTVSC